MNRDHNVLITASLLSLIALGCGSGDSQPGGKSEMERMAEQMERESAGKPVAANSTPTNPQPIGEKNYEKYLLEKYREGVTPENNAAVLFWQAIWPGEFLEPADYEPIAKELGLKSVPSSEGTLESLYSKANQQRVREWLRNNGKPNATEDDVYEFTDRAMRTPWTSESAPPLADWVQENQAALDMLVEASTRPRFYAPSPSLINDVDESIMEMLPSGQQMTRDAMRSLAVRAMWNFGEDRSKEAWQDVLAIYRMSRLVSQGPTINDQLVSLALDLIAKDATLAMLGSGKLAVTQSEQIHSELIDLTEFSSMVNALDIGERTALEDIAMRARLGKKGYWLEVLHLDDSLLATTTLPADWEIASQRMEDFYDRVVLSARLSPGPARAQELEYRNREIKRMEEEVKEKLAPMTLFRLSQAERGRLFAALLLALQYPDAKIALSAQDRANTYLTLTRLAAALAVYRAEHGSYPYSLDALAPGIIDKLPVDCYHENPFVYKPTQNGYTLYSLGPNGADDDGDNAKIEPRGANTPEAADDIAIHMPPLP